MTLPTWYHAGTASVANGSAVVTGVNTLWGDDAIMAGDLFCAPGQPLVPPQRIASVAGNGSLTLAVPWPGANLAAAPYEIRYVGIIERSTAQSRKVLEQLDAVQANGQGLFYRFSTSTADADPGDGLLRLNNAAVASATTLFIDDLDANDSALGALLDTWDDSTSPSKGVLYLRSVDNRSKVRAYSLSLVTVAAGYRKLSVTHVAGTGTFAAGEALMVDFSRTGDFASLGYTPANKAGEQFTGPIGFGVPPIANKGPLQFRSQTGAPGAPQTSGTTDQAIAASVGLAGAELDIGTYSSGAHWLQSRLSTSFASNTDLSLNPNGGHVLVPQKVAFLAKKAAAVAATQVIAGFDTPVHNVGAAFNAASGRFTAPVAGLYSFYAQFINQAVAANLRWGFGINGVAAAIAGFTQAVNETVGITVEFKLALNDYVYLFVDLGSTQGIGAGYNFFGGHLEG